MSNLPVPNSQLNTVDPHQQERDETRRTFYDNYKPFHAYVMETDEGILDEEGQMTYWPWVLRNSGVAKVNAHGPSVQLSLEDLRAKRVAAMSHGGTRKFKRRAVHRSKRVRR